VETWEFVGMHLADLRWTPTPPHGGLEWLLRRQQIHIFMYLDDWLVKNQIRELLLHQLNQTIQLLVDLGLIINLDKCHLVPSQIITYLGAVFNLNKGLVLPSENRFLAINQAIAIVQIHKNVNLLTAEMPTYCGH
jgi:hypothetical protein